MENMERKAIAGLILLLTGMLSMALVTPTKAQYSVDPHTVGLWHFDEVLASNVTLDATGKNPGTLGDVPPPMLVEGKFGKALSFDGISFVYVPISPYPSYVRVSPNLDPPAEITIEAWINVKAFKNVTYNNIVVKCTRNGPQWQNATRIFGLAVKAGLPENDILVPKGALGGFVFTDTGGFNEIVTTKPVISLNQWIQVAFTRSLTTGMHIYVNGAEKNVRAVYGVQNPTGSIRNGTELCVGHDSYMDIDEVRISNLALETQISPFWMQWWFWTVIATGIMVLASAVYFLKKKKPSTAPQLLQKIPIQ